MNDPGWIYAVSGVWDNDPIVKVGRTNHEHPADRAVEVMPYSGWLAGGERCRLWASRSDDVVPHERAAHKALDRYRYNWGRSREHYTCDIPLVLDVLEQVTGNRPMHFPKFVEEARCDYLVDRLIDRLLLTSSPALFAGDPSDRLDYRAIRRGWREFPRGPAKLHCGRRQ